MHVAVNPVKARRVHCNTLYVNAEMGKVKGEGCFCIVTVGSV